MTIATTLLVTLLVSAAEATPPDQAPPRTAAEITEDETHPPPASAEDQVLWRRGKQSTRLLHTVRSQSSKLAQRIRYNGTDARLDALLKAGDRDVVPVKDRLVNAWTINANIYNGKWPVDPTRACLYDTMHFEAALQDTGPAKEERVAPHRKALTNCLRLADQISGQLAKANDDLLAATVEAEKFLAVKAPHTAPKIPARPGTPAAPQATPGAKP